MAHGQHEIRLFRRTVEELEDGTKLPIGWKPMKVEYLDGNRVRITARFWHQEPKQ